MSDIQFKIDRAALRAAISEEIKQIDQKGERASQQILIEGEAAAQSLCRKDTGALKDSIAEASRVIRIAPCQFAITLGASMEYASYQEFGPQSSNRTWKFRPYIRPGVAVMIAKSDEIISRVFGGL